MQSLSGTNFKAVLDKLAVSAVSGSFKDLVAAIALVAEQRVSQMLHVDPYLVSAACFKTALHK